MALVQAGFPVLVFTQHDDTLSGIQELAVEFVSRGARVLLAGPPLRGATTLPTHSAHAVIEPMLAIQSFYGMANALALARGRDPDHPPHLDKVTQTL
jgi:glucosamine--fructose-6-phosphate aminotransferase (isomerizing)